MIEKFLHALKLVPGMHYAALQKLWQRFQDWRYAYEKAGMAALRAAGLTQELSGAILQLRAKIDVDAEFAKLERLGIVAVSHRSAEFPYLLRQIPDPPFLLYRKGAPLHTLRSPQNFPMVAIVGTRKTSFYGEKIAAAIAEALAAQGAVIVSGLAFGIDAIAHRAAIKMHQPTVAILASDLQNIVPPSHHFLSVKIVAGGGTLVSEYAHNDCFYKGRFHERNRLISGLCKTTIVIEAPLKSGALITAYHATSQNRDVYALPGDITRPQAAGCLKLIAEGATPIVSIDDLLERLGFAPGTGSAPQLSVDQKVLIDLIKTKACSTEVLLAESGFAMPKINVLLTSLELSGTIVKNREFLWEIK